MSLGQPLAVEVRDLLAATAALLAEGTLERERLDRAHAAAVELVRGEVETTRDTLAQLVRDVEDLRERLADCGCAEDDEPGAW